MTAMAPSTVTTLTAEEIQIARQVPVADTESPARQTAIVAPAIVREGLARVASFRPEMALFRNLGVNLRVSLCDVPENVSAQTLDFLKLAKNRSIPPRKPRCPHTGVSGWELTRFVPILNALSAKQSN